MSVLLINGSPHEKGCTYTALKEVATSLKEEGIESSIFWLGNKPIGGCVACMGCKKTGYCIKNPMVKEFLSLAVQYHGFVFGSPVHYAAPSGTLTSFMDCLFYSAPKEIFALKPAAAILSARRSGTTSAFDQINKYFTISQMPIVSSCYWNMVHGNTPKEVLEDEEGLYIMRTLGANMAYLLKCIHLGKLNNLPKPLPKNPKKTNFVR